MHGPNGKVPPLMTPVSVLVEVPPSSMATLKVALKIANSEAKAGSGPLMTMSEFVGSCATIMADNIIQNAAMQQEGNGNE